MSVENLLTVEKLLQEVKTARDNGKKIVMTNGCFDVLHVGHITCLNEARRLGDCLIVALNSDASVRQLKGEGRPINSQDKRAAVLASLKSVDYIVIFNEDTPENLIKLVSPDFLVKGGDYQPHQIAGHDHVIKNGGEVVIVPLYPNESSSKIIGKMFNE